MSGSLAMMFESSQNAASKCADVILIPGSGTTPLTVSVSCATVGAHIFYTNANSVSGIDPIHTGDSAGAHTVRIGSNSGSINTGAGIHTIRAVAYEPSHFDSDISEGDYDSGT